jgi:hypothetical protein
MWVSRAVLTAAAMAWPLTALAQVPAGSAFQVNTYTTADQYGRAIAVDARGNFVVAWQSEGQDGSGYGIFAQRFDAAGVPQGPEFRVSTVTASDQLIPSVAADPRGGFVVAWSSPDGTSDGAFARRFDAAGAPRGPEFLVNTATTGRQELPAVAFDAGGNFVVTWEGDEYARNVHARLYDASGTPKGAEFRVNAYTTGTDGSSVVAFDGAGNFVVVWQAGDGSARGVFGRRFDATGTPRGPEFRVNTYVTSYQSAPALAVAADGAFVVAWHSYMGPGEPDPGVFAQRYRPDGTPAGAEFRVHTFTTSLQRKPGLAMDATGNFVVAWDSFAQDGDGYGVFAQRYDEAGTPRGGEFSVNAFTTGQQSIPAVASDPSGNFVVAWHGGQDGSGFGVFAQRFGGLLPAALRVDTAAAGSANGNRVLEPGETVDVRPSWRNVHGTAQTFTGTLGTLAGPAGAAYATTDAAGTYGTVANALTAPCTNCYGVSVSNPVTRPFTHWDTSAIEALAPDSQGQRKAWSLHVGNSFTDVSLSSPFYPFIETLLHHSVTGGCGPGAYCPASATTRAQMAVFALVAREGAAFAPRACGAPLFSDVPAGSAFCRWIEELARRGVVSGCGGGNYCPGDPVTRAQMAVFALATLDPTFVPPACTPPNTFDDVPETSGFCPWIEELARRGVVAGCSGASYCPANPVTRAQMGVFIAGTFGLALYAP